MVTCKKMCSTCLWNWPDLQGGNGRKCYNNGSHQYRKCVTGKTACPLYERRVKMCDWAPYRPKGEQARKGGDNHGGNTD